MSTAVLEKTTDTFDFVGKPKWRELGFNTIPKTPTVNAEWALTAERLRVALVTLAEFADPDEVAEFLGNQGVKGFVGYSDGCPVAVWLKQATDGTHIRVNYTTCAVFNTAVAVFETPPVVRAFYDRFDSGYYPHLLK